MYLTQPKYKGGSERLRQRLPKKAASAKYNAQKSRAQKLLDDGKMPLAMYLKVFELHEDQDKAIALYSKQEPADRHARDFLLDALEKYGIAWRFNLQRDADTEDDDYYPVTFAKALS